jgi:integrase
MTMAVYRRGRIYWYDFWFQGRRIQESTGFTNKKSATDAESVRRTKLLEGKAGLCPQKPAPRFDDQVKQFLAWSQLHHRPKTHELHQTNCDTLLRFFKTKWLDEITRGLVEDFKHARIGESRRNANDGSTISPATVNRALTTLKKLFNHAKSLGFNVANPTEDVQFFDEGNGRMRVVSFEEEIKYVAAASQPLRDIARVILDTGLRPEEVFRIRVENVDFSGRTIFNPFGKTKAARRKVTMTAEVAEILRRRMGDLAEADTGGQLLLFKAAPSKRKMPRGPYVFGSRGDSTRPIGSVRKAHDAAVENAAIDEHFRLYDLRHTFATRAVASGVDLPTLSAILGHTKIQMTMRYVHPAEEQKRAAIAKLEGFALGGKFEATEKTRAAEVVAERGRAWGNGSLVPAKVPTSITEGKRRAG